ncbi:ATP-binding protein [Gaoshiqia sp. Z1-71]|uniref:ATP-binding protein n=1 Tax=Gaoshiqia hydrogeniformans TaxID=3290090 RepID=UPI003BF7DF5E
MESLFERSRQKTRYAPVAFVRGIMDKIAWDARLIGIRGARGVGKTTLLLQYIKLNLPRDHTVIYVSLDHIWFAEHKLYDFTDTFVKQGGKSLFLDEVHKYPNWAQEIKNIYDDFPELKIVFTGSSLLEILNARADLSRRAVVYEIQGFSFREYLNRNLKTNFPVVTLHQIISNHIQLSENVLSQIKVFEHFPDYLKNGYYPFYNEMPALYSHRINEIISMSLEIELPMLRGVDVAFVPRIKQLLQIIAESVPFVPNITKLSERIGITRKSLLTYLYALEESHLTIYLHKNISGISKLQKPERIFLENTNLMYALSGDVSKEGNVRETFFANQLKESHRLQYTPTGDFLIDGMYTFEIGGRNKGTSQALPNAFVAADNIEYGMKDKIPLWLFGFLY